MKQTPLSPPKFSIIIPTRNGHETIAATLRSCLGQEHQSCEIIVSDNFSTAETARVVESFGTKAITYYRTEKPLPMHLHWDFAISKAKGDYLIVLGDDDALLPCTLKILDRLLQVRPESRVITWPWAHYFWPKSTFQYHEEHIQIPFPPLSAKYQVEITECKPLLQSVLDLRLDYTRLPMVYNSMIHRDVFAEMAPDGGHKFRSLSPDVYSGVAIAVREKNVAVLGVPLTVSGSSRKSNGAAHLNRGQGETIREDFKKLTDEVGLKQHLGVPDISTIPTAIADSFLVFRDNYPDAVKSFHFDIVRVCEGVLRGMFGYQYFSSHRDEILEKVTPFVKHRPDLLDLIEQVREKPVENFNFHEPFGLISGLLRLDARRFNVRDVFEAAGIIDPLLAYEPDAFYFTDGNVKDFKKIIKPFIPEVLWKAAAKLK